MTTKKLQWQPIKSLALREEIEQKVRFTAERLKDADFRGDAFLASGAAGLCLLYGQLDRLFPDEGWDLAGHQQLVAVQQQLQAAGSPNLSVWSGLSGTILAVSALSRGGERYQNMIASLLRSLLGALPAHLADKRTKIAGELTITDYDAIQGLAGIGRVLLNFADREEVLPILHDLLGYLVEICWEKEVHGQLVPAWHIPSHRHYREDEIQAYPQGSFNLGLSHGITGPLATLSLALLRGVEVPGQREAVRRVGEWVQSLQQTEDGAPVWPGRVSFEAALSMPDAIEHHARDSWCYGAPGIGRALWLAGAALGDAQWQEVGTAAYRGIAGRSEQLGGLTAPTICHGWSGLMHLVQRMHADTGLPELASCRDGLARVVLDSFSEEHRYGFHDIDTRAGGTRPTHTPGLFEGAAGVALTLLGLLASDAPEWDVSLLIS